MLHIFFRSVNAAAGNTDIYEIAASGSATWETSRSGSPGSLKFSVTRYQTQSNGYSYTGEQANEVNVPKVGDIVMAYDDDPNWVTGENMFPLFYGFVFTASYKENEISYTAYDQLRYLKSKDTMVFTNTNAGFIVRACATSAGCSVGSLCNTSYRIINRIEENTSYFDIIGNALDLELVHKGKLLVLYDDFGKLVLKSIEDMRLDTVLDAESVSEKEEEKSIDSLYTSVKLVKEDQESGQKTVYQASNKTLKQLYGKLQYYGDVQEGEDGNTKARMLLDLYSQPSCTFTIQKAPGDPRVRAGCSVILNYMTDIGGTYQYSYALVERCTHTYNGDSHTMKLELRGGVYSA